MANASRIATMALAMIVLSATPSQAGLYTDDLSKCLVGSTTEGDKTSLVRWMFAAMSLHPDVSSIASVTPEQRTEMARTVAAMFEHLLTESCRPQYRDAVRYEGERAVAASFQLLGQVAARAVFEDPAVSAFMSEFGTFVDSKKLEAAAKPETP